MGSILLPSLRAFGWFLAVVEGLWVAGATPLSREELQEWGDVLSPPASPSLRGRFRSRGSAVNGPGEYTVYPPPLAGGLPFPPCPEGTYASRELLSSSGCVPCPRGRFSPQIGAETPEECLLCEPGRYSATPGQTSCDPCPAGRYGESFGLGTFSCSGSCPTGTFSRQLGLDNRRGCRPCPRGYRSVECSQDYDTNMETAQRRLEDAETMGVEKDTGTGEDEAFGLSQGEGLEGSGGLGLELEEEIQFRFDDNEQD